MTDIRLTHLPSKSSKRGLAQKCHARHLTLLVYNHLLNSLDPIQFHQQPPQAYRV